ncbi:hypothetical protein K443DRAFT_685356 [Laccaria amethystina LaAM-08-1]|uniref:Uncharacterized protein n=1 Tax=Laccaria amethystina LaAM-08-1 TaxID=1095629 RepID=A0A0C9X7B7_9AGAR|nr:hypothetical protein K443DRAFT_685356 [Laccaria amethystina LaAM-08-1]
MVGVGDGRNDEGNIRQCSPLITEVSSNWWRNKRTLKQPTGSVIPTPRHPERVASSEQVLGDEFSRWRSWVAPPCSTESSPSFDYGLKVTFQKT